MNLLGGGIVLKLIWHSVYRQIHIILFVVNVLESIENLLSKVALELVVVFILHMHDEF